MKGRAKKKAEAPPGNLTTTATTTLESRNHGERGYAVEAEAVGIK